MNSIPFIKYIIFTLSLSSIVLHTGCTKKETKEAFEKTVEHIQISTSTQDSDQWIRLSATLNTGKSTLEAINLPIINPLNPSISYGDITLAPGFPINGENRGDISIGLNITSATKSRGLDPVLPNGSPLPVGGLSSATVLALPVASTGARIYFAFGPGISMLGTAIPFKALDPAKNNLPRASYFHPFSIDGFNLSAGVFIGDQTNTTGVGFFADTTRLMIPHSTQHVRFQEQVLSAPVSIETFEFLNHLNQHGEHLRIAE